MTTVGGGTLTVSGGDNRLQPSGTAAFTTTAATFNIGTSQTLAALTISDSNNATDTISGGSLTVNGAMDMQLGLGGSVTVAYNSVVNMSGLSNFTYSASGNTFRVGYKAGSSNTVVTTMLATLAATNSITAANLLVGDVGAANNGGTSTLHLGAFNTINVASIGVGNSGRSNATLDFNSGGSAIFRNTDGSKLSGRWRNVGAAVNFQTSTWTDTTDLSGGTIDALVATTMTIGSANIGSQTGRAGTTNGSFTMGAGTLNAATLNLGTIQGTGSLAASSTLAGYGTFTLNNSTGIANVGTISFATNTITDATGSSTRLTGGTLNLTNGLLNATTIQKGAQTGTGIASTAFNWSAGTLSNIVRARIFRSRASRSLC